MAAEKPRAVDDVRLALADQLDQLGILLRRVLEIGVLDDDESPVTAAKPRRSAAPLPAFAAEQREVQLALQRVEDLAVRRSIRRRRRSARCAAGRRAPGG